MSTPQDKHTPAFKATRYTYEVYIPQFFLMKEPEGSPFGTPTSGNSEVDRNLAQSRTLARLTIIDMARYLAQGARITLEDQTKSVEIYKIVTDLLEEWRALSSSPVYTAEVPVEELRWLDGLAREVFMIARHYMKEDAGQGRVFRAISALESKRRFSRKDDKKAEATDAGKVEHQPVSEAIEKNVLNKTRAWH